MSAVDFSTSQGSSPDVFFSISRQLLQGSDENTAQVVQLFKRQIFENEYPPLSPILFRRLFSLAVDRRQMATASELILVSRELNPTALVDLDPDLEGYSLLHRLIYRSKIAASKILIDTLKEINPEAFAIQDKDGNTPLHLAIFKRKEEASLLLISALKEKNPKAFAIKDSKGNTPLHLVCGENLMGHSSSISERYLLFNEQLALLLIEALEETNPEAFAATNNDGITPLHRGVCWSSPEVVFRYIEALKKVNREALIALDGSGKTPLYLASGGGSPKVVSALLEVLQPKDLVIRTHTSSTPLHFACSLKRKDTVSLLTETLKKRDPKALAATDDNGDTPLHLTLSCQKTALPLINTLGEVNPKAFVIRNKKGFTPLDAAIDYLYSTPYRRESHYLRVEDIDARQEIICDLIQYLKRGDQTTLTLQSEGSYTSLYKLVFSGYTKSSLALLEVLKEINRGALSVKTLNGQTPLHGAIYSDNQEVVQALVEALGPTSLALENFKLKSSEETKEQGQPLVIKTLGSLNESGQSPIQLAIDEKKLEAYKTLLANGLSIMQVSGKEQKIPSLFKIVARKLGVGMISPDDPFFHLEETQRNLV